MNTSAALHGSTCAQIETARLEQEAEAVETVLRIPTVEALHAVRVRIDGEIARRAGEPIRLWDRAGEHHEAPPGGAILRVESCTEDASYTEWYPTEEAGRAELQRLADISERVVDGNQVDLTVRGYNRSTAWIEVRG